ncbi:hypothetical protein MLD38_008955 [Melastoma candidum]|uniref:Uncharacterized protein n=1 Tax=Melastoma candidum TaxID=119954 RepID=A0ACB9RWJ6_9MYRT|nr:hypothetical protein MLD38_008955 [Melastoma candidum]
MNASHPVRELTFPFLCVLTLALAISPHQGPIFHDGMKEWSCCKRRSHDFSEFLAIPGCKTGKHTSEKPSTKAVTAPRAQTPAVAPASGISSSAKASCPRCRQGFFCSDHGSGVKQMSAAPVIVPSVEDKKDVQGSLLPQKKVIDINEPQTCKNKGCGKTFKEKDNHDCACSYHPGPAIFHDRLRGWKCCDVHVKEFDEFMEIPPCTKGWHSADPS